MVPGGGGDVEGSVRERVVGEGNGAGCVGYQRGEDAGTKTRDAEVALEKAEEREEAKEKAAESWVKFRRVTVSGQCLLPERLR